MVADPAPAEYPDKIDAAVLKIAGVVVSGVPVCFLPRRRELPVEPIDADQTKLLVH